MPADRFRPLARPPHRQLQYLQQMVDKESKSSILMYASGRHALIGVVGFVTFVAWISGVIVIYMRGRVDIPTVALLLLSAWLLVKIVRAGIEVSSSDVGVRGAFGARHILWNDIRDIEVRKMSGGGRQVSVELKNGKTLKLPAPVERWQAGGGEFDSKVELLRSSWEQHRQGS